MEFSVLMSVYFKEKSEFLREAIESVLNQTVFPNEVVIIKDGQLTKELDDVINKFLGLYPYLFKIVNLKENVGLGKALCEGVKSCGYEIIARMDTDDICRKDRFEKQLNIFKQNPDIDIVGSYISEFIENTDSVVSIRKVPIYDRQIKNYAKRRNPFNHMTVMYKKDSVLRAGNYQEFLWNEDYHLWVRMILNWNNMYNVPESLVYARAGNDMYKRRGGLKYAKIDIMLQKEYLRLGFINLSQFVINLIIRVATRLMPNRIRKTLYIKFLRN